MGARSDELEMLPGHWRVAATNFPMWLNGSRRDPAFEYRRRGEVLDDIVTYTDGAGRRRSIVGVDRPRGDHLQWRGRGLLSIASSRWRPSGSSADGEVVALRFERTLFTPAGVDVIVRDGAPARDIRRDLAHDLDRFGLTREEFASLTWLPAPAAG